MQLNADEREALNRLRRHGESVVGEVLARDIELLCRLVDRAEAQEGAANKNAKPPAPSDLVTDW